jgi:CDP-diacylglycerol---glycerol-3-phosphate 3-phosphatidyltransferase
MAFMTLAMKLTTLRLILVVPGIVSLMAGWPILSLVIFVAASATDFADGAIARRTKTTSALGAFLDPLADKLLVYGYFAVMMQGGAYTLPLFLAMLARDLVNDGFRNFAASKKVILPANAWGKWKTSLQMLSLVLGLLAFCVSDGSVSLTVTVLVLAAQLSMLLALIAGIVGTALFIRAGKSVLR